jgi:Cu(I)/Ag(I) efflux system membrane protein CusA/SilA
MRRIAASMVGGMVTAPILSMFVIPATYVLVHRAWLRRRAAAEHRGDHGYGVAGDQAS